MAAPISPEEMQAMQAQAGKDNQQPITKLVQDVGQGLSKLSEVLNNAQGATDQDREQMSQIMNMYIDLVEKQLGNAGPGENEAEESPELSQVPVQQGRGGMPMGPNTKN